MRILKQLMRYTAALLIMAVLTGCTPSYYSEDAGQEVLEKGKPMIEAWLANLPGDCKLVSANMMSGAKVGENIYSGYYLTTLVEGWCDDGSGRNFRVIANTADGQLWSDIEVPDLNELVREQLKPYFARYGFGDDYLVSDAKLRYHVVCPDMKTMKKNETVDTEVYLEDVIPVSSGDAASKSTDALLAGAPLSAFNIRYAEQDGSYMPVCILADYLKESGNFVSKTDDPYAPDLYVLTGMTPEGFEQYRAEGKLTAETFFAEEWITRCRLEDAPEAMDCELAGYGKKEEGTFSFIYRSQLLKGTPAQVDHGSPEPQPLGVEIKGNTLVCAGKDNDGAYLYFTNKPDFAGAIRYVGASGQSGQETGKEAEQAEPEEMKIVSLSNGVYTISPGNDEQLYPYYIWADQTLVFQ